MCEGNSIQKKTDWAQFIKELANIHYPKAERIRLVIYNYGTHKAAALYEAFTPEEAKSIEDRFEFHLYSKHGSWLNMEEIELHVLMGKCLNGRIDSMDVVKSELKAWQGRRNNKNCTINWQFKTKDARIKLKRLCPSIKDDDTSN
ncbi:MAG TPA: transposase [Chitinophagaceae bacterium]|nr:transposase [Chitinophagaceae bacterium]